MLSVLLIVAAGCNHSSVHSSIPTPVIATVAKTFLGNESCRDCHAGEFKAHKQSGHANTFQLASNIKNITFPPGRILNTQCRLLKDVGSVRITVPEEAGETEVMEYAMGSGDTGVTFVKVMPNFRLFEMRASYFPKYKTWYMTPGHSDISPTDLGIDYPPRDARKCIGCHTTSMDSEKLVPDKKMWGVGCEACHGPGSAHVEAMKKGEKSHLYIEQLGKQGAKQLNEFCGTCHRTEKNVANRADRASETQRFQPYGLMLSPCFMKSNDTLSCVNCHDSHAQTSHNMKSYEAACLKCHSPTPVHAKQGLPVSSAAIICKVNPRSGCIPCHMPARKMMKDTNVKFMVADHFIHIQK